MPELVVSFRWFTIVMSVVGICTNLWLIFLLIKAQKKIPGIWYLLGWLVFVGIIDQGVSLFIMSTRSELLSLKIYQWGMALVVFVPFFYLFVRKFLHLADPWWLRLITLGYCLLAPVLAIMFPQSIVSGVTWDARVLFFVPQYNYAAVSALYLGILIWLYGIYRLFRVYRQIKSPLEKNRLKYLILGGVLPLIGFLLVSVPIYAIRRYPLDMIAITAGSLSLVYGVIRFRALDISVVLKKGLLYTLVTTLITGLYFLLTFVLQFLFGSRLEPLTLSAALITAICIALVYQPLVQLTQHYVDKVFFRTPYVPEVVLAEYSESLNRLVSIPDMLKATTDILSKSLAMDHLALFLSDGDTLFRPIDHSGALPAKIATDDLASLTETYGSVISRYDVMSPDIYRFMKKNRADMLVVLSAAHSATGLLLLGPKRSGESYKLHEYNLLHTCGELLSSAIFKAKLYHKVEMDKEKLLEALNREREVEALKSEFMIIASHNLRTPLTVMKGALEHFSAHSLIKNNLDRDYVQMLSASVQEMSVYAEELLTAVLMEKSNIPLRLEPVDLRCLLTEIHSAFEPQVTAKKLAFPLSLPPQAIPTVHIDQHYLRTAISSLLDNAIKFTDHGSVSLSVKLHEEEVAIAVADTGKGISKEQIDTVFQKFHQVKKSDYDMVPGLGLGLYIVKLIIKAHHGHISVTSNLGKGSVFTLYLPLQ